MARWRKVFAVAVAGVLSVQLLSARRQAAAQIISVTPAAAREGELVTIKGIGFGALNVQISVGGKPADVIAATGNEVTFRVPAGVTPGSTTITAKNPGDHTGSISFRVLEGILLPGSTSSPVVPAIFDLPPVGVDGSSIQNGLLMNRLELRLAPDATVGQLNAALIRVDGGIVSMSKSLPWVTIAIPKQDTLASLEGLVTLLESLPGIALVKRAHAAQPLEMFREATADNVAIIQHLLPSRFPAAWNAGINGLAACSGIPVSILIADYFSTTSPVSAVLPPISGPSAPAFAFPPEYLDHGWTVALTSAANMVGANPFAGSGCTKLRLVQVGGLAPNQDIDSIVAKMPAAGEKFIVNYSLGFVDGCQYLDCVPPRDRLRSAIERADDALYWKRKTRDRWGDFLMVVAAGNERAEESALIYPAMKDSRYGSAPAISKLSDTLFDFVGDDGLWSPSALYTALGFESLKASPAAQGALAQAAVDAGLIDAIAENVIVVGSATSQTRSTLLTQHVTGDELAESFFSDLNPDVIAVGEDVLDRVEGTSFSAPQVAGLAAYLWQLQPDLRDEPISTTKRAIVANARNKVIDAYASVLSLDLAQLPNAASAPVRLDILDVNGDGAFTELDVDTYLRKLFVVDGGTITRQAQPGVVADFSRYDLNGDGFTTAGARRERFDLDRVGSIRFGRSQYTVVSQNIEGQELRFDESGLTDLEILCYYAYSDMYEGNPDARKDLLAGRCGLSVEPKTATLNSGQTQQFTANVPDNSPVTWTVGACGTVNANGLFTAGAAGTCMVRATKVSDSNQFAEATVTVTGGGGLTVTLTRAASLLSNSFATDFYCPPGPTIEPANPSDSYYTQTPFGRNRGGLSTPPPNVGRFTQVFNASSVAANCRYVSGQANSSEIVVDSTGGTSIQAYISSTTRFGLPAGGEAEVFIKAPADGFVDVTVNTDWVKGLSRSNGGQAIIDVTNLSSAGYGCFFGPTPGGQITMSCSGSTRIPVFKDQTFLVVGLITANGEGIGQLVTLTYTRSQ